MATVYHFTDTGGFKGVIEKAVLWATDFRYLNDSGELIYTWAAFVERLERLAAQPGDDTQPYRVQLEAIDLLNVRDLLGLDDAMFVACFTELSDEVTQWTGYGDKGRGLALGFDSERIRSLKVPQYHHGPGGQLRPIMATVGGAPDSGKQQEFTWGAFLEQVEYGDTARDRVVDWLIDWVTKTGEMSDEPKTHLFNCISQTHAILRRLPLVKQKTWEHEREHRITITEHFGGRSLSYRKAVDGSGQPFSAFAQGALQTVDVKFRHGEFTMFKPYVELPFDREALVKVVTGPAAKHQLVEATVRRILDRNGFRHTQIEESDSPFQV